MAIDDQWQADLCDMQSRAIVNDGNTFNLTCIDCFSKYAWAEPLQRKTGDEIIAAMERIFASGRTPKRLQTDKGSEFTNTKVQVFLRKQTSHFFTTNIEQKASIVERLNRTIKERMHKYFTSANTYRYMDVLPLIMDGYNATYHRSIKMQPRRVQRVHQPLIRQRFYGKVASTKKRRRRTTVDRVKTYKYNVGAWVRISKPTELERGDFSIRSRRLQREPVYYLRDLHDENVTGAFYEPELQRVREPTEYRVEKC